MGWGSPPRDEALAAPRRGPGSRRAAARGPAEGWEERLPASRAEPLVCMIKEGGEGCSAAVIVHGKIVIKSFVIN